MIGKRYKIGTAVVEVLREGTWKNTYLCRVIQVGKIKNSLWGIGTLVHTKEGDFGEEVNE